MRSRPSTMLMNESELRKRIMAIYQRMRQRARPRLWKSGKRAGNVRTPGLKELPFTGEHLWILARTSIGNGVINCSYCKEIGRINLISLENCVFDHKVPLVDGGSWDLSNLWAVCEDCNRIKGEMSYETFIALMQELENIPARDRNYIVKCLRTHGIARQFQIGKSAKPKHPVEVPSEPQKSLLDEW